MRAGLRRFVLEPPAESLDHPAPHAVARWLNHSRSPAANVARGFVLVLLAACWLYNVVGLALSVWPR